MMTRQRHMKIVNEIRMDYSSESSVLIFASESGNGLFVCSHLYFAIRLSFPPGIKPWCVTRRKRNLHNIVNNKQYIITSKNLVRDSNNSKWYSLQLVLDFTLLATLRTFSWKSCETSKLCSLPYRFLVISLWSIFVTAPVLSLVSCKRNKKQRSHLQDTQR